MLDKKIHEMVAIDAGNLINNLLLYKVASKVLTKKEIDATIDSAVYHINQEFSKTMGADACLSLIMQVANNIKESIGCIDGKEKEEQK